MQATFVRSLPDFRGDMRLYRVEPAITFQTTHLVSSEQSRSKPTSTTEYVAVSAVDATDAGVQTYIFPASEEGEVLSWEAAADFGYAGIYHAEALRRAGYTVQE